LTTPKSCELVGNYSWKPGLASSFPTSSPRPSGLQPLLNYSPSSTKLWSIT